jgi:cell division protein FtsI/penicillin-binding protein 2
MHEPIIINQDILSSEYIDAVRRAYRETVLSGSAISLQSLPVSSAGKTGTAQVGGAKEPHGWYTGWAPYENPEIVLTVLVENGVGGGTSAMPVFRNVLSWYFSQ